jgi:hypothetical protein
LLGMSSLVTWWLKRGDVVAVAGGGASCIFCRMPDCVRPCPCPSWSWWRRGVSCVVVRGAWCARGEHVVGVEG